VRLDHLLSKELYRTPPAGVVRRRVSCASPGWVVEGPEYLPGPVLDLILDGCWVWEWGCSRKVETPNACWRTVGLSVRHTVGS
jgi:hypothetical protein